MSDEELARLRAAHARTSRALDEALAEAKRERERADALQARAAMLLRRLEAARGSLSFRIGDEQRELGPGGIWLIPSNVPHSATCGPDGAVVLDVFSPPREDWKQLEAAAPRPPGWP